VGATAKKIFFTSAAVKKIFLAGAAVKILARVRAKKNPAHKARPRARDDLRSMAAVAAWVLLYGGVGPPPLRWRHGSSSTVVTRVLLLYGDGAGPPPLRRRCGSSSSMVAAARVLLHGAAPRCGITMRHHGGGLRSGPCRSRSGLRIFFYFQILIFDVG
jgi:hypothetical protein